MKFEQWVIKKFNKKTDWVLITGASTGIGKEYLKNIAKAGCNCIIASNEDKIHVVAKKYSEEFKVEIKSYNVNLAKYSEIHNFVKKINKFNIQVLINNAGFGLKGDFLSIDDGIYNDIIGVNILAPTILTRLLLNKLRETNNGLVITVASINIVTPVPKNTVYTATKAYLYSYSLALAKENSEYNIYFQTLLPGTTDTPFHVKQGANPQSMSMQPEDVARRSLDHIDKLIYIPNKMDRFLYPIVRLLPVNIKMAIASYMLKKRLGV